MDAGTVLNIVLILLVAAAIWLVVEVVLTVRKARPVLDTALETVKAAGPVVAHVDELVEQAKPVVAHLDEVIEGARPGAQQVGPVLEQAVDAIGALSSDLRRIDCILGDVSRISKSAGNATTAVGDAAGTIASKARTLFSRKQSTPRVGAAATAQALAEPENPTFNEDASDESATSAASDSHYFTYPDNEEA